MAANELFIQAKGSSMILAVGVLSIVLLGSLGEDLLYFRYQHGNRDDWKAAFNFVKEHSQPDDLIISANPEVGAYYLGRKVPGFQHLTQSDLERYPRIWLVEDLNTRELFPEARAWMVQNARLVANFDNHLNERVYIMRVYLYESSQCRYGMDCE
jgi:hypothetical protein